MLQPQIPVAVSDVSITYTAGKKRDPMIQKALNVPGETIIRRSIKGAANIGLHLREVLLPVAADDLQPAKARDVLIGWN